jgi:hypothetical protein
MMMIEVIALKNQESATSTEEKSKHTLLANMYSSRLYAAPAQGPGNRSCCFNNFRAQWTYDVKSGDILQQNNQSKGIVLMISSRASCAGITNQMTICSKL